MLDATKHSPYLTLGMVLVAANMRLPITMMPGLLPGLQHHLGLPSTQAGLLTAIPLLAFAVMSPLIAHWGRHWGNNLVIYLLLVLTALGSYLRLVPTASWLFVGTLMVGIGIDGGNVLIPAVIKDNFPTKLAVATSAYTLSMLLIGALGTGISGMLAAHWSLTTTMGLLSVISLVNLVVWLPNLRYNRPDTSGTHLAETTGSPHISVWRTRLAWVITTFFGLQALVYYSLITWLPTILVDKGFSPITAGTLVTVMQLSNLPMAYIVPITSPHPRGVLAMLSIIGLGFIAGVGGFLLPIRSLSLAVALCLLIGLGAGAAFNLAIVFFTQKTTTGAETADLSGMAQAAGYLLAAGGPIVFGWLGTGLGWSAVLVVTLVLAGLLTLAGFVIFHFPTIYDA
ncbi:MAG TPA: MFS transporter [Candidatus Levilactobacillus faecigallinarum]|uniref:MFS transporter n=1 Tax=Candidatus Levilactobacillus faecigallinarum TaxID=2838638 RepID=A0A9D1QR89_9LACO|nr:MFS transporter [Candidatus Levilactobacillus faecigallinarum]